MFKMLDFSAMLATYTYTSLPLSKAKTFVANTETCVLGRKTIFLWQMFKRLLVDIQMVKQLELSPIRKRPPPPLKHRDTTLTD